MMATRKSRARTKPMIPLQDAVYREMLRLEGRRPGAEMGVALALLRAWVAMESVPDGDREWLVRVSPIGLRMIEDSLERLSTEPEEVLGRCRPDHAS